MILHVLLQHYLENRNYMKERIRQIFDDCGTHIDYMNPPATMRELGFFSEQLIKECISVLEKTEGYSPHMSEVLKKHFDME